MNIRNPTHILSGGNEFEFNNYTLQAGHLHTVSPHCLPVVTALGAVLAF